MGRALRFEASLPIEFWGDCIFTAKYIINKLATPVLGNKTPDISFLKGYLHMNVYMFSVAYLILTIYWENMISLTKEGGLVFFMDILWVRKDVNSMI